MTILVVQGGNHPAADAAFVAGIEARGYDLSWVKLSADVTAADIATCTGLVVCYSTATTSLTDKFGGAAGVDKPLMTGSRGLSWVQHLRMATGATQAGGLGSTYVLPAGAAPLGVAEGAYSMLSSTGTIQYLNAGIASGFVRYAVPGSVSNSTEATMGVIPAGGTLTNGATTPAPMGLCCWFGDSDAAKITQQARDFAGAVAVQVLGDPASHGAVGDTAAPSVPTNVQATATGQTSVSVSWSPSSDNTAVTSYRVRRGATTVAAELTGTSFADSGLTAGTTYSYTVSAVDAAGNRSAESTAAQVTTNPSATVGVLMEEQFTGPTQSLYPGSENYSVVAPTIAPRFVRGAFAKGVRFGPEQSIIEHTFAQSLGGRRYFDRVYRLTKAVTSASEVWQLRAGSSRGPAVVFTEDNRLRLVRMNGTVTASVETTTATLPVGSEFRVSYMVDGATLTAKLYADTTTTTPLATLTSTQNTVQTLTAVRDGIITVTGLGAETYLDLFHPIDDDVEPPARTWSALPTEPPQAFAAPVPLSDPRRQITLAGSDIRESADIVARAWTAGPGITLDPGSGPLRTLTTPAALTPMTYTATYTVEDSSGLTASATVDIPVRPSVEAMKNAAGVLVPAHRVKKTVTVETTPSAPTFVNAGMVSDTIGRLSWQPPESDGGQPITGYRVSRGGVGSDGQGYYSAEVPATARQVDFYSLIPGNDYPLEVAAINATGMGPAGSFDLSVPDPATGGGGGVEEPETPAGDVSAPVAYNSTRLLTLDASSDLSKVSGPGTASTVTSAAPSGQGAAVRLGGLGTTESVWGAEIPVTAMVNGYVRMLVRTVNRSGLRWLRFYMAESKDALDAGNFRSVTVATGSTTNALNYWIGMAAHPALASTSGTVNMTRIGYVQIRAILGTSTDTTVDVGWLDWQPERSAKAKVVFWHDDGGASALNLRDLLAPYGWAATLAPTIDRIGNTSYLTVSQAQGLQNDSGWQIGTHDFSGHASLTGQALLDNFAASKNLQAQYGFTGGRDFAHWGGMGAGEDNYNAVKATFRSGRYNQSKLPTPDTLPPADPWLTTSWLVGDNDTAAEWIAHTEKAIATNGLVQLTFHNNLLTSQLTQYLAWLDARRDVVEVTTIEKALTGATSTGGVVVDPLIVPPSTVTVTATPGGGSADWNDVPAPGNNFGRYEYQVGTGAANAITWGTVRSSGFTSSTFLSDLPQTLHHLRIRSVTTGGREGDWSTVVSWTPQAPVVTTPVDATSRNLQHPFWTTKLASNVSIASTSNDYANRLDLQWRTRPFVNGAPKSGMSPVNGWYDPPWNTTVSANSYSMPIYRVPANQPRVPVYSIKHKYLTSIGFDLDDVLNPGVPLPTPSQIPGGRIASTGTDASCIIIQENGDGGYEVWEFIGLLSRSDATAAGTSFQRESLGRTVPDSYQWRCTQAGHIKDHRTHSGWWESPPDLGVSAAGHSYLGTALKWEDWDSGVIRHPLGLALPVTGKANGSPTAILPATRGDVGNFTNSSSSVNDIIRIPEGARFQLNPSFDIPGWAASKARSTSDSRQGSDYDTLVMVMTALRDYGLIINDRAGGVLGFSAEGAKSYGTPYGPGPSSAPVWGNFATQLPWQAFRQVAIPPNDISNYAGESNQPPRAQYDYSRMV